MQNDANANPNATGLATAALTNPVAIGDGCDSEDNHRIEASNYKDVDSPFCWSGDFESTAVSLGDAILPSAVARQYGCCCLSTYDDVL